jgi:hypothetical protein
VLRTPLCNPNVSIIFRNNRSIGRGIGYADRGGSARPTAIIRP